jgi:hypothetical protein
MEWNKFHFELKIQKFVLKRQSGVSNGRRGEIGVLKKKGNYFTGLFLLSFSGSS